MAKPRAEHFFAVAFFACVLALLLSAISIPNQALAEESAPQNSASQPVIFSPKDNSKLEQFKACVYNGLLELDTSIDVSAIGITAAEVKDSNGYTGTTAARNLIRFHPLFSTICISGAPTFTYASNGTIASVDVTYATWTWTQALVDSFKTQYADFYNGVPSNANELQKALYTHDWVCEHVSYGTSAGYADFAIGAIANGKAICAGYSYAYQFLAQQIGLECNYVSGTTKVEAHAWNKVKICGQWFLVDTTWDRSLTSATNFGHTYCLLNDTEFAAAGDGSHNADTDVSGNSPVNVATSFGNKFWQGIVGPVSLSSYSVDPQLNCDNHAWNAGMVTKEPTCTTKGTKTYTCTFCGTTKTEDVKWLGHNRDVIKVTKEPTCAESGKRSFSCSRCGAEQGFEILQPSGHKWGDWTTTKQATYSATGMQTRTCSVCKTTESKAVPKLSSAAMYRLYNPNSGEHFYTADASERNNLKRVGWKYEGVGWTAPTKSNTPVYRLYSGTDHHYTTDASERDYLIKVGWKYEGVGWYSDDAKGQALYRQFNPNVDPKAKRNNSGSHNYTTSKAENDSLVKVGWRAEGIGWYGVK